MASILHLSIPVKPTTITESIIYQSMKIKKVAELVESNKKTLLCNNKI
jgi:hypothetical protein